MLHSGWRVVVFMVITLRAEEEDNYAMCNAVNAYTVEEVINLYLNFGF